MLSTSLAQNMSLNVNHTPLYQDHGHYLLTNTTYPSQYKQRPGDPQGTQTFPRGNTLYFPPTRGETGGRNFGLGSPTYPPAPGLKQHQTLARVSL